MGRWEVQFGVCALDLFWCVDHEKDKALLSTHTVEARTQQHGSRELEGSIFAEFESLKPTHTKKSILRSLAAVIIDGENTDPQGCAQ